MGSGGGRGGEHCVVPDDTRGVGPRRRWSASRAREYLASAGRIVDGSITETQWEVDRAEGADAIPETLIYRYRIAGVTYECAQDVSPLSEHVRHVRIDLPVQVRFDPRNPGTRLWWRRGGRG